MRKGSALRARFAGSALAFISVAASWYVPAGAQPAAGRPEAIATDALVSLPTYRLWRGRAEDATSDDAAETPTITVFAPQAGRGNGVSVIVAPGGGYVGLSGALEGREVGDWFSSRGITAFVLKYRVGPQARLPIPLYDGRRAMQFVRANAAFFKIDPDRIGMIGFSAGGHLAAMTAGLPSTVATSTDPLDAVSARPDFLILAYPWLEGTAIDAKGKSQYCMFAGRDCDPKAYERYAPIRLVSARMPPTFLYHTTTDHLVPVAGSLRYYEALHASGVPVELHVFGVGEHGTGMGGSNVALARWPDLLEQWLRGRHLLEKIAAVAP